jgi:hypothetical protein
VRGVSIDLGANGDTHIPRRFKSAKKVKVQNARTPTVRKGISARTSSSLNQSISHAKFSSDEYDDKTHITIETTFQWKETRDLQGNVSHKMAEKRWSRGEQRSGTTLSGKARLT